MIQKEKIFSDVRAQYEKVFSAHNVSNAFIESCEFKAGPLLITLQTDFDNHLETILELNGKTYSNGGDYMPSIQAWIKWQKESLLTLSVIKGDEEIIKEDWYGVSAKRVGGGLIIGSDEKVFFRDTENNWPKLILRKKRNRIRLSQ
jgi:hypothetical protein